MTQWKHKLTPILCAQGVRADWYPRAVISKLLTNEFANTALEQQVHGTEWGNKTRGWARASTSYWQACSFWRTPLFSLLFSLPILVSRLCIFAGRLMGLRVLYLQQKFMRIGRIHKGVHVLASLCFTLPRGIAQNVLFSLEWKCSNILWCLYSGKSVRVSTWGFYWGLSSAQNIPGSQTLRGKQEFGRSQIVCTNSRYNEPLSLIHWWLRPLAEVLSQPYKRFSILEKGGDA